MCFCVLWVPTYRNICATYGVFQHIVCSNAIGVPVYGNIWCVPVYGNIWYVPVYGNICCVLMHARNMQSVLSRVR